MLDFVSIQAPLTDSDVDRLLSTAQFHFDRNPGKFNPTTGEIIERKGFMIGKKNGLILCLINTKIGWVLRLRGSIHDYSNGNNYSDLFLKNVQSTINSISTKLGITASSMRLVTLEVGCTIQVSKKPEEIFDRYISRGKKFFSEMHGDKFRGVHCENSETTLKCYDTGAKHALKDIYLFKFELKIKDMRFLQARGIPKLYLSSLQDLKIAKELSRVVLDEFDKIFKIDFIRPQTLSVAKQRIFNQKSQISFWKDMRLKNAAKTNDTLYNFKVWQEKYRDKDFHGEIRAKLEKKFALLLSEVEQPLPNSSPFNLSEIRALNEIQAQRLKNRQCVICGNDISHARKDAKTCSRFCRNRLSNPFNSVKRTLLTIERRSPTLFASGGVEEQTVRARIAAGQRT